jgi:signal transduction histidine kinase
MKFLSSNSWFCSINERFLLFCPHNQPEQAMANRLKLMLWVCCCLLAHTPLFSQQLTVDSVLSMVERGQPDTLQVEYLTKLSSYYIRRDLDKAIHFANRAGELAERTGQYYHIGKALTNKSVAYLDKGMIDSVNIIAEQAEAHFRKHPNVLEQSNLYSTRGHLERRLGRNDKAFEWYLKSVRNIEENAKDSSDRYALPAFLNNVAISLRQQGDYDESLRYLKKALALAEAKDNKLTVCVLLSGIGSCLEAKEDYEGALESFQRSLVIKDEIKDEVGKISLLTNIGRLYVKTGRFEAAETYLQESFLLSETLGYTSGRISVLSVLANFALEQKDYSGALDWGQKALALAQGDGNKEAVMDLYDLLAKAHAEQGSYEIAYKYRSLYATASDSAQVQKRQQNMDQLRMAYEVEKTEQENEYLKEQRAKDRVIIGQRNTVMMVGAAALLLLILVVVLIYRDLQRKQSYSQQLETTVAQRTEALQRVNKDLEQANYELSTLSYIASHDIKEPIRVMSNYVGLIRKRLPEEWSSGLKDYFEIIQTSSRQLYTLIEDFMRYSDLARQDNGEAEEVDMRLFMQNLTKTLDPEQHASGKVEYRGLETVSVNRSMLFLVLKNLVENGLKYNKSEQPQVLVSCTRQGSNVELRVTDNGIGIPAPFQEKIFEAFKRLHSRAEYGGTGLGLAIVKLAVGKLGGEIRLESEEGKGSTFIVSCREEVDGATAGG